MLKKFQHGRDIPGISNFGRIQVLCGDYPLVTSLNSPLKLRGDEGGLKSDEPNFNYGLWGGWEASYSEAEGDHSWPKKRAAKMTALLTTLLLEGIHQSCPNRPGVRR